MTDIPNPAKILIVDDSPTILMTFSKILAEQGYLVRTAQTGAEAISEATNWKPNCILLDYFLPDMTGEEVLAIVRTFDQQVQIILVTAYSQQKPALEMMQSLDIQGFFDKRDDLNRLILWVSAALKAHARLVALQERANTMQRILTLGRRIHQSQPTHMLMHLLLDEVLGLVNAQGGVAILGEDVFDIVLEHGDAKVLDESKNLIPDVQWIMEKAKQYHEELLLTQGCFFGLVLRPGGRFAGCAVYQLREPQDLPETELKILVQHVNLAMDNNHLHGMATVDQLTGLASRAYFTQRFREWLQLSVRHGNPLSLIFIDLDKLKKINDTYGHHIGDQVLALVGKRIRASIRATDVAGRQGGDEFVIITPNTPWQDARIIAERICQRIASLRCKIGTSTIQVSASIGFGGFDALPATDCIRKPGASAIWDELSLSLLEWVDKATYEAKQRGGGVVVPVNHDGQLSEQTLEKLQTLCNNLTSAMKR